MTPRNATLDDVPGLVELCAIERLESPRLSRAELDPAKAAATFAGLIGQPHGFVKVVDGAGGLAGCMAGLIVPHWASAALLATDLMLYVRPDYRGGLGAARLIGAYRAWAAERGARWTVAGIGTGIHADRTAALYERLGFKRCGILLEADHGP